MLGARSSLLHHFLILRSGASRVSKDEATVGASWFETALAHLLTMRIWRSPYSTLPIFFTAAIRRALSSATNFENSGASM